MMMIPEPWQNHESMSDEKKDQPSNPPNNEPNDTMPAHSTEQERERLKDFNKDGIPPGSC